MSKRAEAAGDMVLVRNKIASRYDSQVESEVLDWMKALLNVDIEGGMSSVENALRDGQVLINLARLLQKDSPNCPPAAKKMKLRLNTQDIPYKQMENIQTFLLFCEKFGVSKMGIFHTVDLYEGRNLAQVISCLQILGSESQRAGYPNTIGPKFTQANNRNFSKEVLRQGHGIVGCQAGSNKYATQKGMRIGSVRHCADIRADDLNKESNKELSLVAGTNRFATQKGMTIGGVRHGADIRSEDISKDSHGLVILQAGSNKFASQKGIVIGGVRHGSDIRADDLLKEGQTIVGMQAGSNKFASQVGMTCIGAVRHAADIRADELDKEGQTIVGLQAGTNKFASQSGMVIGGVRHVADIRADDLCREGQATVGMQMGSNKYATQQGLSMGAVRHVADIRADDVSKEGSSVLGLQMGTNKCATMTGISFGAVRHGADLNIKDISYGSVSDPNYSAKKAASHSEEAVAAAE